MSLPLTPLKNTELSQVIRVIRATGVGNITFFKLLKKYGTIDNVIANMEHHIISKKNNTRMTPASEQLAQQEIMQCRQINAEPVLYGEKSYPPLLAQIADPPPLLWVLGKEKLQQYATAQAEIINNPSNASTNHCQHDHNTNQITPTSGIGLAIVGSRNASAGGRMLAENFAEKLSAEGFCIISGLARGIDTNAHNGAIKPYIHHSKSDISNICATIGVIAGGIDTIFPPENHALYNEVIKYGAIITEHPPGMAPHANSFPSRNRIISALSQAVLVIEAAAKSGSIITAKQAAEQNREVLAVPGSPLDPRCSGTNLLLKQGATICTNINDIRNVLIAPSLHRKHNLPISNANTDNTRPDLFSHHHATTKTDKSKLPINIDASNISNHNDSNYQTSRAHNQHITKAFDNISKKPPEQQSNRNVIISALSSVPINSSELSQATSLPIHIIQQELSILEIEGLAMRCPSGTGYILALKEHNPKLSLILEAMEESY